MTAAVSIFKINRVGAINIDEAFGAVMGEGGCILNVSSMSGYMLPEANVPRQIYALSLTDLAAFEGAAVQMLEAVPQEQRTGMAYMVSKNYVSWHSAKVALRNAGQVPMYCGQKNGSGYHGGNGMVLCKYVEGRKAPLRYFGEGLSYTEFEYSELAVTEKANSQGSVEVSCVVTNTGSYDGEEVVQVYVTDEMACMLRPAQELAGFYRVHLKAGESKRVRFSMRTDQFAFLNREMQWIVEAGKMTVKVGSSSRDIRLTGAFEITDTSFIDGRNRGFYAKAWEA